MFRSLSLDFQYLMNALSYIQAILCRIPFIKGNQQSLLLTRMDFAVGMDKSTQ